MPQNLLLQKNIIIGVVVAIVVLGGGYYWYDQSDTSGSLATEASVDPNLLSPDLKAFYALKDSLNLKDKDLAFIKKPFYSKLEDNTVDIPSVEPDGRNNPFVPYVAPGSIR